MKSPKHKKIFPSLNLVLFCCSLLFSTLSGFSDVKTDHRSSKASQEINANHCSDGNCSQMPCEKIENENENETEHDLHELAVVLPFSITYFSLTTPKFLGAAFHPLAEKLSNPIYISVCNFRV